jgi:hypothetical protein
MTTCILRDRSFSLRRLVLSSILGGVALGAVGCESKSPEQTAPKPIKVHNVRVLYPPEARALFISAIEQFNAKNIALSSGEIARISGASFEDMSALGTIGGPSNPASLWIAPLMPLTKALSTQPDRDIVGCESLMSTRLGIAVRPIDTFTLPPDCEKLSIGSVLSPQERDRRLQPAIIVGSPRFSSSGLLTALATVADATHSPLEQVSAQSVSTSVAALKGAQERVRNYVVEDSDGLEWIAGRPGGDPVIVVTSEQAVTAFKEYHSSANLEWLPLTSWIPPLDYPLCDVVSKTDTPIDIEAAKLAKTFLLSDEFKKLTTAAGFSPPVAGGNAPVEALGGAIGQLLTLWPQIRRPASTVFVVDTSVKTDRAIMETIRREISLFVERRPAPSDTVALVSASTDAEVLREPTTDPELLKISIKRMTTAGGNATRDGIETAFNIFEDITSLAYRRSIIVFTSASDTSSQTTVEQLTNRASQLVGRKNVDLFVVALGRSEQEFGELPAITRKVGGTFVLTDIASLPGNFYGIARRVQ